MLKAFKRVTEFYANNTVYISDGDNWEAFPKHNWEVKSLKNNGDDLWITSGVVVALGASCEPADALKQLQGIVRILERNTARQATKCEHCNKPIALTK